MSELEALRAVERRIASFGLPGAVEQPLELTDERWTVVGFLLELRSLTGLALAAAQGGALRISRDATAELVERHRAQMLHALSLERLLLRVGDAFGDRQIPFVVLKGPALAHALYPDPSWRPFGDLDLLVRTPDWRAACSVLAGLGFRRGLPEPVAGFDERFGKAATHTGPGGLQIDLHRALALGPFGVWIRPEELFDEVWELRLGGRMFLRLNDTALLLHAAVHASLGRAEPLPMPVRDVAQVALAGEVDRARLADLTRRWHLAAVVGDAFAVAERHLGVTLERPLTADDLRATARERRALASYQASRGVGGVPLAMLRAVPGLRNKSAYVRSLVMPNREFMAARAGGRVSYVSRWRIPLRWMRHRILRGNRLTTKHTAR
ncbi:MAG TPA: nucleotidyltransferase family protein [Actinomycetota bacterium]